MIIPFLNSYLINIDQNLGIGEAPSLLTDNLTEGSNLFYTDARVNTLLTAPGPIGSVTPGAGTFMALVGDTITVSGDVSLKGKLLIDTSIHLRDDIVIEDIASIVQYARVYSYIDDGLHLALGNATSSMNRNFIFTDYAFANKNHDHSGISTNPTVFFHSSLNPDTSNNQWGSLSHNQENFVLNTGANIGTGAAPTTDNNGLLINPGILTSGGTDNYAVKIARTLNDSGAAGGSDLFNGLLIDITETDKTGWDTVNLMDLQVDTVSKFKIDDSGNTTITGSLTATGSLLIGSDANFTDFPNAKAVISQTDTTYTSVNPVGIVGEATANEGIASGRGVVGIGLTSITTDSFGVLGVGKVAATGNTGLSIGVAGTCDDTHAGGDNIALYASATNGANNYSFKGIAGTLYNADDIVSDGDIYTTTWTDYGGSSTVVGWSSFSVKKIYYKKVGKLVFVWFHLEGTSNSTAASFTLPYNNALDTLVITTGFVHDNGVSQSTPGRFQLIPNGATVNMYLDMAAATFTASGTKEMYGTFFYEAA